MGMLPGYDLPSGSLNPPPLTDRAWIDRHKKSKRETLEEKNQASPGCMHACCGPSYGPNDRKLVIKNATIHKLWLAFWKAGISYEDATVVVQDMQKNGIFFREEE